MYSLCASERPETHSQLKFVILFGEHLQAKRYGVRVQQDQKSSLQLSFHFREGVRGAVVIATGTGMPNVAIAASYGAFPSLL
jgi:hypothetical protein